MYLYLYHSDNMDIKQKSSEEQLSHSDFSGMMVRKALRNYCESLDLEISDEKLRETAIQRGEKGKPYFTSLSEGNHKLELAAHYSVSHSGNWWGCLMAEEPVGFDMEVCREKVNHEKIAQRFFTKEEYEWILSGGLDAFFDIWVRKEAYVKYLGSGLGEGLDSFSVVENGQLAQMVSAKKDEGGKHLSCFIQSCEIQDGVKAAYCSSSGKPVKTIISL